MKQQKRDNMLVVCTSHLKLVPITILVSQYLIFKSKVNWQRKNEHTFHNSYLQRKGRKVLLKYKVSDNHSAQDTSLWTDMALLGSSLKTAIIELFSLKQREICNSFNVNDAIIVDMNNIRMNKRRR